MQGTSEIQSVKIVDPSNGGVTVSTGGHDDVIEASIADSGDDYYLKVRILPDAVNVDTEYILTLSASGYEDTAIEVTIILD